MTSMTIPGGQAPDIEPTPSIPVAPTQPQPVAVAQQPVLEPVAPQPTQQEPQQFSIEENYRNAVLREEAQREQFLLAIYDEAIRRNPDARAEAVNLADALGVAPDAVEGNLEVMRALKAKRDFTNRNLAKTNPDLAMLMGNLEFATVASDDIDNMDALTRLATGFRRARMQTEALGIAGQHAFGMSADLKRLAELRTALRKTPDPRGFIAGAGTAVGQMATHFEESVPFALMTGAAYSGATAISTAMTGPGAIAAGAAAFPVGFFQGLTARMAANYIAVNTGENYLSGMERLHEARMRTQYGDDAGLAMQAERAAGKANIDLLEAGYDAGVARVGAIATGMVTGALDIVGDVLLLKGWTGSKALLHGALAKHLPDATKALAATRPSAKAIMGSGVLRFGKDYAGRVGGEMVVETFQAAIEGMSQSLTAAIQQDRNIETVIGKGEFFQSLVDAAWAAAEQSALIAVPGAAYNAARRQDHDAQRAQTLDTLAKTAAVAAQSKVQQRAPAAVASAVNAASATEEGPPATVAVDAGTLLNVLSQLDNNADQHGGIPPSQRIAQGMPDVMEQAARAAVIGDPVFIPVGDYVAYIAMDPALHGAIVPLLDNDTLVNQRLDAARLEDRPIDADDAAAIEEARASQLRAEEQAAMNQQWQAESREVYDTVLARATQAGLPHDVAQIGSRIVRAVTETLTDAINADIPDRSMHVSPREAAALLRIQDLVVEQGDPNVPGQAGRFVPERLAIVLTNPNNRQNPVTFLHELSHFFHHMFFTMARDGQAPQRVQADVAALLGEMGLQDIAQWDAMTENERFVNSEKVAHWWEQYLAEGRAPSAALQGTFARIGAMMRRLYRVIRDEIAALFRQQTGQDLPGLTPTVQAVFDRWLANANEIEFMLEASGLSTTFDNPEQVGMDPQQWADHLARVRAADNQSVAEATASSIRAIAWAHRMLKRGDKQVDEAAQRAHAQYAEQARIELERTPVRRLVHWIRTGIFQGDPTDPDGQQVADEIGENHRLSRGDVRVALSQANIRYDAVPDSMLSKKGMPLDVVARVFGFDSATDLVRELANLRPIEEVANEMANERMRNERPEFRTEAARQRPVDRALHNDIRARVVAEELRWLSGMLRPVRALIKAARIVARQAVSTRHVGALFDRMASRIHTFQAGRFAKQMNARLAEGDREGAAHAQRNRLLQQEMAREVIDVQERIEKAVDKMRSWSFKSDERLANTKDVGVARIVMMLLDRFGITDTPLTDQQQREANGALDRLAATDAVLARRIADVMLLPAQHYEGLTVAEFDMLTEVANATWTESTRMRDEFFADRAENTDEVAAEVQQALEALPAANAPGRQAPVGRDPNYVQKAVMNGWDILALMKSTLHWARYMDGGRLEGVFQRIFDRIPRQLHSAYQAQRRGLTERLGNIFRSVVESDPEALDREIPAAELGYTFRNMFEVMAALSIAGSESGRRRLLLSTRDGGATWGTENPDGSIDSTRWDAFVARMWASGILNRVHADALNAMWALYAEILPQTQDVHRRVNGYEIEEVIALPSETPHGQLTGGYAPLQTNHYANRRRHREALDNMAEEVHAIDYSLGAVANHTVARNPNAGSPLALDFLKNNEQLDQHLRYIHFQEYAKFVQRLLRREDVTAAFDEYDRTAMRGVIYPMVEALVTQADSKPGNSRFMDGVYKHLRASASLLRLGYNVVNSLLQLTGMANTRAELQGRYIRSSVAAFARNPREAFETAANEHPAMRDRQDMRDRMTREEIQRHGLVGMMGPTRRTYKRGQQALSRTGFWAQRMLQGFVDVTTYNAAKQQYYAQQEIGNQTPEQFEQAAREYAVSVVERTQGSNRPEGRSQLDRGTPFQKLFTQFQAYGNTVLGTVLGAQPGADRYRAIFWAVFMPAMLEATIRITLLGVEDDDDDGIGDDIAMQYLTMAGRNVTGLIPGVGGLFWSMAESEGTRMSVSPGIEVVKDGFGGVAAMVDAMTGGETTGADLRKMAAMLTLVTGYPFHLAAKPAAFIRDVEDRKIDEPDSPIRWGTGLLIGRPAR